MTRARDNSFNPFNNQVAGKNAAINGAFDFWQRGTSFTGTMIYTADRWFKGTISNYTHSRQTAGLEGFQYCMRVQRDSGSTQTSIGELGQSLDTATSLPFANKTVTMSFWARAGVNYSSSSNILVSRIYYGAGTDQNAFTGYVAPTSNFSQNNTLTTNWQRFTHTMTLPSTVTEFCLYFAYNNASGTAGANDYFEITGVQIELGSNATQFSRAGGTIGGELALCQRYYTSLTYDNNHMVAVGMALNSGASYMSPVALPVPMRVTPSVSVSSASHFKVLNAAASAFRIGNTVTVLPSGRTAIGADYFTWVSGDLVAGNAAQIYSNSASCEFRANAEL